MNANLSPTFILLILLGSIFCQANFTCTPEMVESYGILSHGQAKKERLVMCPQIQYSCCPAYEQFKMFKTYSESIKPSYVLLNDVIVKELALLQTEVVALAASGLIDNQIQQLSDQATQMRVQYSWNKIKGQRPKAIFEKLQKYQKVSSSYVAAWKSAFFCTICDFANQSFIDINKKQITFSADSCDALVQSTLLYTNLLNAVLIPYLSSLTEIITRLRNSTKYQKLHNHRRVIKAIKDCKADYLVYDKGLGNCKNYCEYFNLASDSYILEGYPEFFANTLVEIRLFANPSESRKLMDRKMKGVQNSVKGMLEKSKARNLKMFNDKKEASFFEMKVPQSAKFKGFNKVRILQESKKFNRLLNAQKGQKKLEDRRVLAAVPSWAYDSLDPRNNVTVVIDIFDQESSDPDFDDAMINEMMEVQDIFNTGDPQMYAQMIRKYYVENFQAELDDIDSTAIFKETSLSRIDYSEFETVFSFGGIEINDIVQKMNWSLAFKQIGLSLTSSGNVESEMIFPDVVQAINSVANRDVRTFYTNQFIRFNQPNYLLYNQTMTHFVDGFAIKKLRMIIAQNMAVYNYLVENLRQDHADQIWSEIQYINSQLSGLTLNDGNTTASLYNYTNNYNKTIQGLRIASSANASGFANVTFIPDVNSLASNYNSSVMLVNVNQNAYYNTSLQLNQTLYNSQSGQNGGNSQSGQPQGQRKLKVKAKKQKLKK